MFSKAFTWTTECGSLTIKIVHKNKKQHTWINNYIYVQLEFFVLFKIFLLGCLWWTNGIQVGTMKFIYSWKQWWSWGPVKYNGILFATVHSLYVVEIVVLQFFPPQLERICNKACLGGPRLWAEMHLHWNLKSLEFNCIGKQTKRCSVDGDELCLTPIFLYRTQRKERIQM